MFLSLIAMGGQETERNPRRCPLNIVMNQQNARHSCLQVPNDGPKFRIPNSEFSEFHSPTNLLYSHAKMNPPMQPSTNPQIPPTTAPSQLTL